MLCGNVYNSFAIHSKAECYNDKGAK